MMELSLPAWLGNALLSLCVVTHSGRKIAKNRGKNKGVGFAKGPFFILAPSSGAVACREAKRE